MSQITDTGFAQPAKAAAAQEHEKLRWQLEAKARQEQTGATYKVSARELLLVARKIHDRMTELNSTQETVLAEGRACGWLHWRPLEGRLQKADSIPGKANDWARRHTEGSSRLGPDMRAGRSNYVTEEGRPLAILEKADVAIPEEEQVASFYDEANDLTLAGQDDCRSKTDALRLDALLLHPSVRQEVEEELAQLALLPSQKKEKEPSKPARTREEKAKAWRERDWEGRA